MSEVRTIARRGSALLAAALLAGLTAGWATAGVTDSAAGTVRATDGTIISQNTGGTIISEN